MTEINKIICADAFEGLKTVDSGSVDMCVTSPPYYGLRDYGVDGQIGIEQTPEEYIARLTNVFNEIFRVLKDDGTLWVNIADSYADKIHKWAMKKTKPKSDGLLDLIADNGPTDFQTKVWSRIKPKDMIGIPWVLALELRSRGWYLRSDIIWHKTNALPEGIKDRPIKSYEHILLFSKSDRYYFDYMAIREPTKQGVVKFGKHESAANSKYLKQNFRHRWMNKLDRGFSGRDNNFKKKRDVWEVSTNTYKMNEHFAMFPEKLIEPCILAGSKVGGIVLDPFFGSGTTGAVAKRLGRNYIGIDLNPRFCELAKERIGNVKAKE